MFDPKKKSYSQFSVDHFLFRWKQVLSQNIQISFGTSVAWSCGARSILVSWKCTRQRYIIKWRRFPQSVFCSWHYRLEGFSPIRSVHDVSVTHGVQGLDKSTDVSAIRLGGLIPVVWTSHYLGQGWALNLWLPCLVRVLWPECLAQCKKTANKVKTLSAFDVCSVLCEVHELFVCSSSVEAREKLTENFPFISRSWLSFLWFNTFHLVRWWEFTQPPNNTPDGGSWLFEWSMLQEIE